jgi:hypothetical protein
MLLYEVILKLLAALSGELLNWIYFDAVGNAKIIAMSERTNPRLNCASQYIIKARLARNITGNANPAKAMGQNTKGEIYFAKQALIKKIMTK